MTLPGACIELRERAHDERAAAARASSAEARRAHLELSFRLEKIADERRSGPSPAEHRVAPFVDLRVELGKAIERAFPLPSPAPLRICWTRSIPLKNGSAVHEYKDATAIGRPSFQAPSAAFMSGDGFSLGPPTGRALGQIRPVAAG